MGNNRGLDLFSEQYKGYYIEDSGSPVLRGLPKLQRRDIETVGTGISGLYFFHKRRFSVIATYNFYERQVKSARSLMAICMVNGFRFKADSTISHLSNNRAFGDGDDFLELGYSTVVFAPGFACRYVLKQNWLPAGAASLGSSMSVFQHTGGQNSISTVNVLPYLNTGAAARFNSERFFAGVIYAFQTVDNRYEHVLFTSCNGTFRLSFGYRFREVGVLKKCLSEKIKPKRR